MKEKIKFYILIIILGLLILEIILFFNNQNNTLKSNKKNNFSNESERGSNKESINNFSPTERVLVLNYHFFYDKSSDNCNEILCLDKEVFNLHLKYLLNNGYNIITMDQFIDWYQNKIELPKGSILITIDDGAAGTGKSNGNILIPMLEKYNISATLFLITDWFDIDDYESKNLNIQSHGHNIHFVGNCGKHQINCISQEELYNDVNESINIIGNNDSFAYPFYDYTEESFKILEKLGFKIAFIGGQTIATRHDYKYKIPRYEIFKTLDFEEFKNVVSMAMK